MTRKRRGKLVGSAAYGRWGKKFKKILAERGLTARNVSVALGLARHTVGAWLLGRQGISWESYMQVVEWEPRLRSDELERLIVVNTPAKGGGRPPGSTNSVSSPDSEPKEEEEVRTEAPGLAVFWPHAQYPYLLWGTGTKFEGLYARVEEYGNSTFLPVAVMERKTGEEFSHVLTRLAQERKEALRAVGHEYDEKLAEALGDMRLSLNRRSKAITRS